MIRYAHQYASLIPISAVPMVFWKTFCLVTVSVFLPWLVVAAGLGMVWFDKRLRPTRLWLLGFSLAFPGANQFAPTGWRSHFLNGQVVIPPTAPT
jgi:hypothetical protein